MHSNFCNGYYQHYRNKRYYRVKGVAKHSETQELLVVYKALYGEGTLWARPAAMFLELVLHEGRLVQRFTWVHRKDLPTDIAHL